MLKYIKIPSFFIILLFFISFYFNIIPINCIENDSKILDVNIEIHPDVYSGWYACITILTVPNVTSIHSSRLYREGNTFYLNVTIEFGENVNVENFRIISEWHCYTEDDSSKLYNCYDLYLFENGKYYYLKEGNYSFILNVNNKTYIKNFTINRENTPPLVRTYPYLFWNGEEWILEVTLHSNLIPKEIFCLDPILIEDKKIFEILIGIEEWEDEIPERTVIKEYNFSLGILPEGEYWFHVYVNGKLNTFVPYEVSRILTTKAWSTVTDISTYTKTYSFSYTTITTTYTITEVYEEAYTTYTSIKVKESSEIGEPKTIMIIGKTTIILGTKTIQKSQTSTKTIQALKEIPKGEFKIEQFTIPTSLFIIVIMITFLLYYILFKRREI
ncbi:MAG: hypothetical protein QW755_06445 [Nitrososphaerota archaeon]